MKHPRIVTVPTADHHDALVFALSIEMMREALGAEPGARLGLHLPDETLTWGSGDVLTYERVDRSGRRILVELDGARARHIFAQLVRDERMDCDPEPQR